MDSFKSLIYIILYSILFTISCLLLLSACANIAAPTGGLYDVDPPKVVSASPNFNAVNNKSTTIEIIFDENIKVEKPMDKVIIAPPQQSFPIIKAQGRKVIVELEDDLLPNTTYTIDFTDAIVDNNEGNTLDNFALSFSTGDQLDTLAVSGTVLTAENLEPVQEFMLAFTQTSLILHSPKYPSNVFQEPIHVVSSPLRELQKENIKFTHLVI